MPSDIQTEAMIPIKDLPREFLMRITRKLVDYTVIMYRGGQQLGSGTLVQVGETKGILTAHHVIHCIHPPLNLTGTSSDVLLLTLMESRHSFELPASHLVETEIAVPTSDENGPDLTFLAIPPGDKLATLDAIKYFWRIDFEPEKRRDIASRQVGLNVIIGQPHEFAEVTQEDERTLRIDSRIEAFFGSASDDRIFEFGDFDFLDTDVRYTGSEKLPESFGGMSGGGLWNVTIRRDAGNSWSIEDVTYCGVAFYQTERHGELRTVRCHFAKSIYEQVRARLR